MAHSYITRSESYSPVIVKIDTAEQSGYSQTCVGGGARCEHVPIMSLLLLNLVLQISFHAPPALHGIIICPSSSPSLLRLLDRLLHFLCINLGSRLARLALRLLLALDADADTCAGALVAALGSVQHLLLGIVPARCTFFNLVPGGKHKLVMSAGNDQKPTALPIKWQGINELALLFAQSFHGLVGTIFELVLESFGDRSEAIVDILIV